ncbi:MAG: lipid A export permease/ATP-binding protein MsbA [Proteobacteria bacterium]|nr:lipid A export permease/ATP-binding protein MsbA [Pseudomonadota bacterium]
MSGLHLYRRLLRYVKPYRGIFALAVLGMLVVTAGDLMMAALVMPIVTAFQKPGGITASTPDNILVHWLPVTLIAVFLLRGIGSYVSDYAMSYTGLRVVFDLRRELIDKLLRLPTSYYDQHASGTVQSKLTFDAHQLASAASGTVATALRGAFSIVGGIGFLMYLNWKLTLLVFVILPLIAVITRYFSRRLRRLARDIQTRTAALTHTLEEMITGHRIVRVFGGEDYERARAVASANALRHSMTKQSSAGAASTPLSVFFAALGIGFIVWVALQQSDDGRLDLGLFLAYTLALITLLDRMKSLSGINGSIQRGMAASESIFGMLDLEDEPDAGTIELQRAHGQIRYERVSLRYAGGEQEALTDVSLDVAPGETVALVGASGSGKTSLVNLIPRFYAPSTGRLFIDGHDITTLTVKSLRAQIALVSQDILLFDDTIAANIAYGAMADAPRDAVERAALAANALDFIRALPQGFDTMVGEQGLRLSGGQRQRIAIARAVLKDAPILILDEATSALDSESERMVQTALDTLMEGRTTLVIAHRLSTIEHADRIVVLDAGRIVETGTHRELVDGTGAYARLHRIQFAKAAA